MVTLLFGCSRKVSIYTIPSESTITINGNKYTAPATVKLKPGNYRMLAELDGYVPETFSVNVTTENVRFSYHLTPRKVMFGINVEPENAKIMLGDQQLQSGINMVTPGEYRLRVSLPTYRTVEEDLVLELDQTTIRDIVLDQAVKLTVNMNYRDRELAGFEPEEYSRIKFYSNGKGYLLKDLHKMKLELGKDHVLELREAGETFKEINIPAEQQDYTLDIDSFNEASFVVESVYDNSEEYNLKRLFSRMFDEDNSQYYSYFVNLYKNYEYDILLFLLKNGSYSIYSESDSSSSDLYKPLLINDDVATFKLLEEAGAEKSNDLISKIIENNALKCLEHVLTNMTEEQLNSPINYPSKDDFRGGVSYLIFEAENNPEALKLFINHGAKVDVVKVMRYYDFEAPGTKIHRTSMKYSDGVYTFTNSEEVKEYSQN